jgi:hypothetical protein
MPGSSDGRWRVFLQCPTCGSGYVDCGDVRGRGGCIAGYVCPGPSGHAARPNCSARRLPNLLSRGESESTARPTRYPRSDCARVLDVAIWAAMDAHPTFPKQHGVTRHQYSMRWFCTVWRRSFTSPSTLTGFEDERATAGRLRCRRPTCTRRRAPATGTCSARQGRRGSWRLP